MIKKTSLKDLKIQKSAELFSMSCAGILEQSMRGWKPSMNRVVLPARQATYRLAESIFLNGFLGSLKV
jgi:hypothetical protein